MEKEMRNPWGEKKSVKQVLLPLFFKKKKYIYIYIYTHTHTHIYIIRKSSPWKKDENKYGKDNFPCNTIIFQ